MQLTHDLFAIAKFLFDNIQVWATEMGSCWFFTHEFFSALCKHEQRHSSVHSFVSSHVDYCNALLVGAPKVTTDKLRRVTNAAARVITGTHKFDRGLSWLLHTELHWLNVPEQVTYKLCIMVHSCLQGQAPQYLVDLCQSVSDVASRQHLRSASRRLLVLPHHRLQTYVQRAFSVAGPSARNSLPDNLRDSSVTRDIFRRLLKTHLFALYWSIQHIRGFTKMHYTNLLLITYLSVTLRRLFAICQIASYVPLLQYSRVS